MVHISWKFKLWITVIRAKLGNTVTSQHRYVPCHWPHILGNVRNSTTSLDLSNSRWNIFKSMIQHIAYMEMKKTCLIISLFNSTKLLYDWNGHVHKSNLLLTRAVTTQRCLVMSAQKVFIHVNSGDMDRITLAKYLKRCKSIRFYLHRVHYN